MRFREWDQLATLDDLLSVSALGVLAREGC